MTTIKKSPIILDNETERYVKNLSLGCLLYVVLLLAFGILQLTVWDGTIYILIWWLIGSLIITTGSLLIFKKEYKISFKLLMIGGILTMIPGIIIIVLRDKMVRKIVEMDKNK